MDPSHLPGEDSGRHMYCSPGKPRWRMRWDWGKSDGRRENIPFNGLNFAPRLPPDIDVGNGLKECYVEYLTFCGGEQPVSLRDLLRISISEIKEAKLHIPT